MESRAMIGAALAAMLVVAALLYGPALMSRTAAPHGDVPTEPIAAVVETEEPPVTPVETDELEDATVVDAEAPDPAPRTATSERAPRDEDCDLR